MFSSTDPQAQAQANALVSPGGGVFATMLLPTGWAWLRTIGTTAADTPRYFEWAGGLSVIEDAIRQSYDLEHPAQSMRAIGTIWEKLDEASRLAEARSRVLLARIKSPPLVDSPSWLDRQVRKLKTTDAEEAPVRPEAVESASKAIRACLATIRRGAKARIAHGINGRVEVDWEVSEGRLQWMVEAPEIPWPGVKVFALSRQNAFGSAPKIKILRNVFSLIEHFNEHIRS
jgi:hypothetical protein